MRQSLVIFSLSLFFLNVTNALSETKFTYPIDNGQVQINSIKRSEKILENDKNILRKSKYYILNGNLDYAKALLTSTNLESPKIKKIYYRYLATIDFIQGKYEGVIKILSKPEFNDLDTEAPVCFMRVISNLILEKIENAKISWRKCYELSLSHSDSDLLWMNTLVNLKTSNDKNYAKKLFENIKIDNTEKKFIRIFLKLALYLNKSDVIHPRFKYLDQSILEDEGLRELIGFNYYRDNKLGMAYQLLENSTSSNTEIFKGNLSLYQKKYELAYAQYKLALKRKENSQNALERLAPLAWKLEQWSDGLSYIQKIDFTKNRKMESATILSAFLTMLEKHETANIVLRKIRKNSNQGEPLEVSQLFIYNLIEMEKYDDIALHLHNACNGNDGSSCWALMAQISWEGIFESAKKDIDLEHMKENLLENYSQQKIDEPILETIIVNQKEIEELDNNLIQLVD